MCVFLLLSLQQHYKASKYDYPHSVPGLLRESGLPKGKFLAKMPGES